jgi:hypothetical protein
MKRIKSEYLIKSIDKNIGEIGSDEEVKTDLLSQIYPEINMIMEALGGKKIDIEKDLKALYKIEVMERKACEIWNKKFLRWRYCLGHIYYVTASKGFGALDLDLVKYSENDICKKLGKERVVPSAEYKTRLLDNDKISSVIGWLIFLLLLFLALFFQK